jgi:hypothetical protein
MSLGTEGESSSIFHCLLWGKFCVRDVKQHRNSKEDALDPKRTSSFDLSTSANPVWKG